MANVTAISPIDSKVEFSTDRTTWTDASGFTGKIEWSGGERDVADNLVFAVDRSNITIGKPKHFEVTLTGLYNSGSVAGNPYRTAETAYLNRTAFYLRWSPVGLTTGSAGTDIFTAGCVGTSRVIAPPFPSGLEASAADNPLIEIKIAADDVYRGTM